jgi:putative intracellular protease/amidase
MGAAWIVISAYVAVIAAGLCVIAAAIHANRRRDMGNWTPRERAIAEWARRQTWRVENNLPMEDMHVRLYLGINAIKVEAEAVISKDGRVTASL